MCLNRFKPNHFSCLFLQSLVQLRKAYTDENLLHRLLKLLNVCEKLANSVQLKINNSFNCMHLALSISLRINIYHFQFQFPRISPADLFCWCCAAKMYLFMIIFFCIAMMHCNLINKNLYFYRQKQQQQRENFWQIFHKFHGNLSPDFGLRVLAWLDFNLFSLRM